MREKLAELAFQGNWIALLPLLHEYPHMINSATENKGYTALHQAAWHGASTSVIGQLLSIGANPTIKTSNKRQTAREIAATKYPDRSDLQFLLSERGRTIAQMMRKVVSEMPELFFDYDGNRVLCDRLIESFGADSCCQTEGEFGQRLAAAFKALTGTDLFSNLPIQCGPNDSYDMQIIPEFWADRFLKLLRSCESRCHTTPIEKHWAVISDLFDPAPSGWGLRGDLFLWMEMSHSLCHVPLPDKPEALTRIISSAFTTLTGVNMDSRMEVYIPRFARGGMSSGMVSCSFWNDDFVPMMQQRGRWLQESWGR